MSRLDEGHSANSPTFSSAAAYTFSAASLHTPPRNPYRQALRLVRCSQVDVPLTAFPADSRPGSRLVFRPERTSRNGVRHGLRPETRLGVPRVSLREPPRCSTRVPFRVRSCASESDTLAGASADAGRGTVRETRRGALRGGCRYGGRGGKRGGRGTLNALRDRCL